MRRLKLKLVPGKEYLFTHRRKGTFCAEFKRIVRAPSTDTLDEFYYECEVDPCLSTNPWSQEDPRPVIVLRPSLITVIQNVPTGDYARHHFTAFGQNNLHRKQHENWVSECIYAIRSAIRSLKKT